ncbi:MAG: hypothetical protein L3J17_14700 [Candidatus Jettenia sp.]|nr:MAG: hypothetical protein L3J17_14700 [Candidatus Jettenia sp.]
MPGTNEATDTDLKVIERLHQLDWKRGDTLLYRQMYALSPEYQKMFNNQKSIEPNITLTNIHENILARKNAH